MFTMQDAINLEKWTNTGRLQIVTGGFPAYKKWKARLSDADHKLLMPHFAAIEALG